MSKNNKKHIVSFSGGLDSVYLVNKLLKEGDSVEIVYVEIANNEEKTKREKKAIEYFYNFFDKKYYGKISKSEYTYFKVVGYGKFHLPQSAMFITSLLYSIYDGIDTVNIAYVQNDDALSYIEDIKNIYYSYQPLFDMKLPELKFPLSKTHKATMLCELKNEHGKEFLDNITFCEQNYEYDNCGECEPCKRFMRTISDFEWIGYKRYFKNYDNVNYGKKLDNKLEFLDNLQSHHEISLYHNEFEIDKMVNKHEVYFKSLQRIINDCDEIEPAS